MSTTAESGKNPETMKTRRLVMAEALTLDEVNALAAALDPECGVALKIAAVEVSYDLVDTSLEQVEDALQTAGARLDHSVLAKLHRAMLHYTEETELGNLKAPRRNSCCNRPPVG